MATYTPHQERHPNTLRREHREWLLFALFIGPNLLLFSVFTYWPLLYNVYLSMVRWDFLRPTMPFVGLQNYISAFSDPRFWNIIWQTATFTVWSVGLTLVLGLLLALLLNQSLRYRNTARAIVFAPVVMSGAVVAVVWSYIFDPRYGLYRPTARLYRSRLAELAGRSVLGHAGGDYGLCVEEHGLRGGDLPRWPANHSPRVVRRGAG